MTGQRMRRTRARGGPPGYELADPASAVRGSAGDDRAQPLEAPEIGIEGHHDGVVLEGNRGEVGVVDEVSGRTGAREQPSKQRQVPGVGSTVTAAGAASIAYGPVEPNPPTPRTVSSRSSASNSSGASWRTTTSCAIRSPRFTSKASSRSVLSSSTLTSPR